MNKDTLTTVLGIGQAAAVAIGTYIGTAMDDGSINYKSPVFWLGLVVAAFMGVKGYYTKGTDTPTTPPVTKPS